MLSFHRGSRIRSYREKAAIVPTSVDTVACAIRINGLVQGVGFRPHVHRSALQNGVSGFVRNESGAVYIEVEGNQSSVDAFVANIRRRPPPLARIDHFDVSFITPEHRSGFSIGTSRVRPDERLPIAPDIAMCTKCEAEMLDPNNRRYRYPFITCTDCGPRYTIIKSTPYDRTRTTMREFNQCKQCTAEFLDPLDRRHHSQTNSCFTCGPSLQLLDREANTLCDHNEALVRAANHLIDGSILALRGLGGFHLAVDAGNDRAVRALRYRKHRDAKPFAIMVASTANAACFGYLGQHEIRRLQSPERPVVLLTRKFNRILAPSVAPGLATLGVMLAYTPLHRLILEHVKRPLVMTSGNLAEEPICISDEEALQRLSGVADVFLTHNREIYSRYDDSVIRVVNDAPVFIRRARGYAPMPIPLPIPTPKPVIAVGPHLKNTFAIGADNLAYVSQHIGDLENLETLEHFQHTYETYRTLFSLQPRIAARDLHPGYLSTRIASELGFEHVIPVQHHHAHVAAVAGEHGVTTPVIGVAFDGTGYGDDGCIWGGEVLVSTLSSYRRVAHLRYAMIPGGDLAAKQPWRSALGFLSLEHPHDVEFPDVFADIDPQEIMVARRQIERGINAHQSSSVGRLFDAVAAILGLRQNAQYEGQAAMELEALAGAIPAEPLPLPVQQTETGWIMDPLPLLVSLAQDCAIGHNAGYLAALFHESLAATIVEVADRVRRRFDLNQVVLSGGVFQNARLLTSTTHRLTANNYTVLTPRDLGPNDGAISYGQAVVAAAQLNHNGAT